MDMISCRVSFWGRLVGSPDELPKMTLTVFDGFWKLLFSPSSTSSLAFLLSLAPDGSSASFIAFRRLKQSHEECLWCGCHGICNFKSSLNEGLSEFLLPPFLDERCIAATVLFCLRLWF